MVKIIRPTHKIFLVVYVAVCFFVFMTAFQTTRNQIETLTKADVITFNILFVEYIYLAFWNTWSDISRLHLCRSNDWIFLLCDNFIGGWTERRISYCSFWLLVIYLNF